MKEGDSATTISIKDITCKWTVVSERAIELERQGLKGLST